MSLHLSQRQLRLITAIGTGVLVGTALVVIIPEGIETLYSASNAGQHSHVDTHMNAVVLPDQPVRGGAGMMSLHRLKTAEQVEGIQLGGRDFIDDLLNRDPIGADDPPPSEIKPPDEDEDEGDSSAPSKPPKSHENEPPEPHAYIGLALILGFALMYLIDVLPHTNLTFARRSRSRPLYISLNNLHRGAHSAPDASPALNPADDSADPSSPAIPHSSPPTTTLGLVIHAIADGIALGASSASTSTSTQNLGLIVFLALMLHKAPAAFGLTAVLLKQGLSTRAARAHLIVFSLAAPAGALATWVSVNVLGSAHLLSSSGVDETGVDRAAWWTGLVLVFSGGTFLYVAMHSMQETTGAGHSHGGDGAHGARVHGRTSSDMEGASNGLLNPYAGGNDFYGRRRKKEDEGRGVAEIGAVVVGMMIPLVVQVGHVH